MKKVWGSSPPGRPNLRLRTAVLRERSLQPDGGQQPGRSSVRRNRPTIAVSEGEVHVNPPATRPDQPALVAPVKNRNAQSKAVDFSVTAVLPGEDLPPAAFNVIGTWMTMYMVAGVVGYERGGQEANGHAQATFRGEDVAPSAVTKALKATLAAHGFSTVLVMTKVLSGRGIHTFVGMIGYCTKDRGHPHFQMIRHNVSDEQLQKGREEHIAKGAGPLKKRTVLGPTNIVTQMVNFITWHMPKAVISPDRVLLRMLRSSKYYPSACWVTTGNGRGLHGPKMNCLWKSILTPELLTLDDIRCIFYNNNPEGRYHTEAFGDDAAFDADLLPNDRQAECHDMHMQDVQHHAQPSLAVYDGDGFAMPPPPPAMAAHAQATADIQNMAAHDVHQLHMAEGTAHHTYNLAGFRLG
mmetsp:Transcript_5400/g.11904  ORF Transcript_5400/g.11904 Transcript_5400/m.11904 type:complete len:409 (+) Transcript_5400:405-1631(+)